MPKNVICTLCGCTMKDTSQIKLKQCTHGFYVFIFIVIDVLCFHIFNINKCRLFISCMVYQLSAVTVTQTLTSSAHARRSRCLAHGIILELLSIQSLIIHMVFCEKKNISETSKLQGFVWIFAGFFSISQSLEKNNEK